MGFRVRLGVERGEDLVFAEEAGKRGNAGEGKGPDQECPRRDRHHMPESTEAPHVDHAPHGVHHRTGAEEEQGFEEGMRDEVENRRGEPEHRAGAEGDEHVAELADRGIREHPLEIVLHRGDEGSNERRRRPDDRHHRQRPGATDEQRRRAGDEVDAGGDHRRGVDQGAGGGRPLHRVGQPDMERHLGALAAGGQEHEEADRRADSATDIPGFVGEADLAEDPFDDRAVSEVRVVEVERAVGHPEQEGGDGQTEVADAVDEERLLGGPRGLGLRVPKADEKVAAGPHRFPEDVHKEEIARGNEHRHREHEHRHQREEPRIARVVVHVADRIDGDEQSDAGDDREERGGERIETQRDRDREGPSVVGRPRSDRGAEAAVPCCGKITRPGVFDGGPLPERGDHLDRFGRTQRVTVTGADLSGGAEQEEQSDDRGSTDPCHGREVRPGPEPATEENGADGPQQRQQGDEHQEVGG